MPGSRRRDQATAWATSPRDRGSCPRPRLPGQHGVRRPRGRPDHARRPPCPQQRSHGPWPQAHAGPDHRTRAVVRSYDRSDRLRPGRLDNPCSRRFAHRPLRAHGRDHPRSLIEHIGRATFPRALSAAREGDSVSLAVFALVVVIWVALLVPIARRGRAELAWEASEGGSRLSGGARPWTTGNLLAEPADDEAEAEAAAAASRLARRRAVRRRAATRRRRVLLLLVVATAAGSRAWAVLGGRWWLAVAVSGLLLAGFL